MDNIVGFLSDYGLIDNYVGTTKAVMLSNNPDLRIIDITHGIRAFDVVDAALKLKWSFRYFPIGTVFLICVDPNPKDELIILSTDNYFLVCPNNGTASLLLEEEPLNVAYTITADHYFVEAKGNFRGRNMLAPIAAQLARLQSPKYLGSQIPIQSVKRFKLPDNVKVSENFIQTIVIDVDRFGNVILNLRGSEAPLKAVDVNGKTITLSSDFSNKQKGELFACLNPENYYEIVAYRSSAAKLLSLKRGMKVRVRF